VHKPCNETKKLNRKIACLLSGEGYLSCMNILHEIKSRMVQFKI